MGGRLLTTDSNTHQPIFLFLLVDEKFAHSCAEQLWSLFCLWPLKKEEIEAFC
jgi:hypothetical protein